MADHQDYTDNRVQIKSIREGDYLLIDLVKYNSHLYNKELKDFKDIEKREQTWHEIAASLNISVNECQQKWVRLREKFSKEKRVQEEFERTGNNKFKLSTWPFYEELRFLEPFIKRRNVYHKPKNFDSKLMKNAKNENVSTTLFNGQAFTQIKPISTTGLGQSVDFKSSNLSFVQVPKTVMVQLVGSNQNQNCNSIPIKTETLNVGTSLPSNVEVVYQNEESTSESGTSLSEKADNSNKRRKIGKRKCVESTEDIIANISSIIQRYLETCKRDENPDEIFGKLVAGELAKKMEPEKTRLKKTIMEIIWNDDLENEEQYCH
ncbi:uncharacterized protein LOC127284958 isoform X2 [Leptopilina boulardi]|nr:uncharacterized protein LOC127284958 isoform X2 [Leptopilina boulardi]XP_051166649.1 uncharacterized protein LOC127284958 isoform X2 [Leptopilina boulardi]